MIGRILTAAIVDVAQHRGGDVDGENVIPRAWTL